MGKDCAHHDGAALVVKKKIIIMKQYKSAHPTPFFIPPSRLVFA